MCRVRLLELGTGRHSQLVSVNSALHTGCEWLRPKDGRYRSAPDVELEAALSCVADLGLNLHCQVVKLFYISPSVASRQTSLAVLLSSILCCGIVLN